MTRWICKQCGGPSPTGVGYPTDMIGPLPAPDPACPNRHAMANIDGGR